MIEVLLEASFDENHAHCVRDRAGLVHFGVLHEDAHHGNYVRSYCYCGETFEPAAVLGPVLVTCLECVAAPSDRVTGVRHS